jgi:type IV secretion system protein VirB3
MSSEPSCDPLFLGLTRPTMILGVSLNFFVLNLLVSTTLFLMQNSIKSYLMSVVFHGIGYLMSSKDARFIEVFLMKMQRFNLCPNKSYYGSNSYLP